MTTASTSRRFNIRRWAALSLGLVQLAGAGLWCQTGAGIYGSPLTGMSGRELAFVGSIILSGPVVALAAGLLGFQNPRLAGRMLLAGAALSAILGARYQEVGLLLAAIVSLPMCLMGFSLWQGGRADSAEPSDFRPEGDGLAARPKFQFSVAQLMLVMGAVCAVLGLSLAHAAAARQRTYVASAFAERLMTSSQFAREPETGANMLRRLQYSGGGGAPMDGMKYEFYLNTRRHPPPVAAGLPVVLAGLRAEVESQLRSDGARVLGVNDLTGMRGQLAGVSGAFRMAFRWERTQGTFSAWPTAGGTVRVELDESRMPGMLELH